MGAQAVEAMPAIYNGDGRLTQDQLDCFTQAFAMFDADGSGAISGSEFREVCLEVGMTPTDAELQEMIRSWTRMALVTSTWTSSLKLCRTSCRTQRGRRSLQRRLRCLTQMAAVL